MIIMKINISRILFLVVLQTAGTWSLCEFPSSFQGAYMLSKYNSLVNVNVSHIDGLGLIDAPLLEGDIGQEYECFANNGSKYVIRSVLGDKLPSEAEFRYIFLCMDLTIVSDIKATFVQATNTGPGSRPSDVKFLKLSEVGSDPLSSICDIPESSYLTTMYSVFLKTSNQPSWPQTCPTELLGVYSTQDPACPASWDACVDNSYIQVDNTSSCSVLPLFSANGSLICVHEVRSGNITFLHVYNNDNEVNDTNTFRYTCIALQKNGDSVQLSQNPGDCVANQRPDTATTLGKTTFTFTQPDPAKLCPVTSSATAVSTTSTPTPTAVPVLTAAATAGLVLGVLGLLGLVLLLVVCLVLWMRKKRMEVVEIKRRSEGREERRRRRIERRLRRMQEGHEPCGSDSDSIDSGYSGRSTTSLVRPEERHGDSNDPDESRKFPEQKTRRVFDEEGNLLYEQKIPRSSDQEEEGIDDGVKRVKPKRKKKTRKYTKTKTLPDGTEVKEVIESDHWSTDSDNSPHSVNQDPTDVHLAKQRREKEHLSMVERSTGSNTKTLVTRPDHEKTKPNATLPFSLPGIFKSLAKGKRKLPQAPPGEEQTPREADRYMEQYQDKKDTERRLDDEGFWEDPKVKKTALEIFDFDNLDRQLDGSQSTTVDDAAERDQHQDEMFSRLSRHTALSTEFKNQTLPDIERPSSLVSGSHDDAYDDRSVKGSDTDKRATEKARILASLSRLLTERLFYDDETARTPTRSQSGKVIFVDEYGNNRPASQLSSAVKSRGSQSQLRHSHHAFGETANDTVNVPNSRPGSQSIELPPVKRSGYHTPRHTPRYTPRYTPHGKRQLGPDKAAALRYGLQQDRGYLMHLLRGPWPTREAWNDQPTGGAGRPWTFQHGTHSNNTDDTNDIDHTKTSGDMGYLDIDDARLRRLLEELYGDKKYMDALLAAGEASSSEEVKALAEHGRNYLLQMALYWEEKGPLPPRPPVTALGFRMERAKTASPQEAKSPTLQRNKTMD